MPKNHHYTSRNESRAIANSIIQKNTNQNQLIHFLDNRVESSVQQKLNQVMKLESLPIQRFKGAEGTNQEGEVIPFTLNEEFTNKHVGEDKEEAIDKTQARLDNEGDQGGDLIREGNIGNTVAKEEDWTEAINGNEDEIPEYFMGPGEEDKAEEGYDPAIYDESEYSGNSSYMEVSGWNVTYEDEELTAEETNMNRKVAGQYKVENLDVSIDINHCTQ